MLFRVLLYSASHSRRTLHFQLVLLLSTINIKPIESVVVPRGIYVNGQKRRDRPTKGWFATIKTRIYASNGIAVSILLLIPI